MEFYTLRGLCTLDAGCMYFLDNKEKNTATISEYKHIYSNRFMNAAHTLTGAAATGLSGPNKHPDRASSSFI